MALIGTPGKTLVVDMGASPSRGIWSVDTLSTPLYFTVHQGTLYSVNNSGTSAAIGVINTSAGDVSMSDDGQFLTLVDGIEGWWYDMVNGGALTKITDGNFTTTPKYVTWQEQRFAVASNAASKQWQLSGVSTTSVWPAVNINFAGSGPGKLQAILATNSILEIFGDKYTEFWQNAGFPDFPYANIPGSSQEFGLTSPWSLFKYDNSIAGLFKNNMGESNISRMSGFGLKKLSNFELESLINAYTDIADCTAFGFNLGGHPMAQFNFPTADRTWLYDGAMDVWSQLKDANGSRDWGHKYCTFLNKRLITDYRNGRIYKLDPTVYSNNGDILPFEVTSKHIWNDDKEIGISQVQVDIQAGVGLAVGQGSDPQMMLSVSKDGGNSFNDLAWTSMGKVGEYTQRVVWRELGSARDWVLRLKVTDPVKRVVTGASAEMQGGPF